MAEKKKAKEDSKKAKADAKKKAQDQAKLEKQRKAKAKAEPKRKAGNGEPKPDYRAMYSMAKKNFSVELLGAFFLVLVVFSSFNFQPTLSTLWHSCTGMV